MKADSTFKIKYATSNPSQSLQKHICGKLNFIKDVRGAHDPLYNKLKHKYLFALGEIPKRQASSSPKINELLSSLWVLSSDKAMITGTAFELRNIGVVTCAHVYKEDTVAFRAENENITYKTTLKHIDYKQDLAIIELIDAPPTQGLELRTQQVARLEKCMVAGFPNHNIGDTGYICPGYITGTRNSLSRKRILISAPIIAGNSGGPVVDDSNKVIGVAATGADDILPVNATENYGVIPSVYIQKLATQR